MSTPEGPLEGRRHGIALLNMGSPASAGETRDFLFRLFSDPDIFHMPGGRLVRPLFAFLVSTLRAPKVSRRYEALGGVSPLLAISQSQASALEECLSDRGAPIPVEVCMRYSRPLSEEAVTRLVDRGAESIIGLPLYPQFSKTTTGSSLRALREAVARLFPGVGIVEISDWHQDAGYHQALARRVLASAGKMDPEGKTGILFLAHSVPERFIRKGDPYVDQIRETVSGVVGALREAFRERIPWFVAYQGQVGPVRWVGPTVEETLRRMTGEGIRSVVVAPVSFVSDHLETLYEIDVQYRQVAHEMGVSRFERIEALNASEDFIRVLADLVCARIGIGG